MGKMAVAHEKKQDWDVVKLSGVMTEEAGVQLLSLYDNCGKNVRFHFANVSSINSNGVRAWMLFFRDFRVDRQIEFTECSPAVVAQMNMMTSFAQKARIASVVMPCTCSNCRLNMDILIEEKDFPKTGRPVVSPARCKACGGGTEVVDEGFFDFLASR